MMKPTQQQLAAIAAFERGETFRLRAVAGAGKTTTLRLMAEAAPRRRILYVAFNRAIAEEARAKFPRNTQVKTLHGLAWNQVVRPSRGYSAKLKAANGKISPREIMEATGLSPLYASALREAIERFIRSEDPRLARKHISKEFRDGRAKLLGKARWAKEEAELIKLGQGIWKRIRDPEDPFAMNHDTYVRVWKESQGAIRGFDAVLVDEAQDLDPNFAGIIERSKVQRVYVGDPLQQIYAWRGAVNAMQRLSGPELLLSKSFRFGEGIAEYVRWAMRLLTGRPIPLEGAARWESELNGDLTGTRAYLGRTNLGLIAQALALADLEEGPRPPRLHFVGGIRELVWLLEDAARLRHGAHRASPHPELAVFADWSEVEELADEGFSIAQRLVKLAERYHDLSVVASELEVLHVPSEEDAVATLSTVHKAKGREWDSVLLVDDFPSDYDMAEPEEPNIVYVALTRAKRVLWPGGLDDTLSKLEEMLTKSPGKERADGTQGSP